MALSFFRALNPASDTSGITYLDGNFPCRGTEMLDYTVTETIHRAFYSDLDYFNGIMATYEILVGQHYDLDLIGSADSLGGEKGALDYLIFPLIARKLIADSYLEERQDNHIANALAWIIAVPLELARFSAAIALTLFLLPVVSLVHIVKAFSPPEELEARYYR